MADIELTQGEQLTAAQVAELALNAGFNQQQAAEMVAIAKNESHYDAGILNDTAATGDYSVGLWQINYYDGLRAGRTKEFGTPQELSADPASQAVAAHTLFEQSGLGPWAADTHGIMQANLPEGEQAVQDALAGKVGTFPAGVPNTSVLPESSTAQGANQSNPDAAGGTGVTGTYQEAANALGSMFQYIDAFLNPDITVVPGWLNSFTGANTTVQIVVKFVDRGIGLLIGIGFVYMGVHAITGGGGRSGPSLVGTTIRTAGNVAVGNEMGAARTAATEQRERASQRSADAAQTRAANQAYATQARKDAEEAKLAQRQREGVERQAREAYRNRLAERRVRVSESAEQRRNAETRRTSRRVRERVEK